MALPIYFLLRDTPEDTKAITLQGINQSNEEYSFVFFISIFFWSITPFYYFWSV